MEQPQGFVDPIKPNHVWKLHRTLYGLKQAARAWYEALKGQLKAAGLQALQSDNALFYGKIGEYDVWVNAYVDDLLIISSKRTLIEYVIGKLNEKFIVKSLGDAMEF